MRYLMLLSLPFAVAACNQNTSAGADREAQVDPPSSPAPQAGTEEALAGIATEAIKVETMTEADIQSLEPAAGNCRFVMTEVGKPSLVFEPGERATIKLNGKMVALPADDASSYAEGGLEVRLRPVDGTGDAGLSEAEMLVVLPGAKDELGYRGYSRCP